MNASTFTGLWITILKHPDLWAEKLEMREATIYWSHTLDRIVVKDRITVKDTGLEPDLPAEWWWAIYFHSGLQFFHWNVGLQYLSRRILVFYYV